MLFDLKGKRRRTVQITYVALAFLMAVGLIGAGVGSGTSGGIFDLFSGGGGSSTANKTIDKRIKNAERALRVNPKDPVALASLVRSHYTLASANTDQRTGQFGPDGKKELVKASAAWQRYVGSNPKKPDASLAGLMLVAYSDIGLNQPPNAATAAEIVATARNDAQAWLQLVQYASLAHQTRKAELAGQKAIDRAPKNQRKLVKQSVAQAKAAGTRPASAPTGGSGASTTTVPGG
jgi:tetratricopeptide (TPR) repeat protein